MITETETRITETVAGHKAQLVVRHDHDYLAGFHFSVGCIDEWLTVADIKTLVKIFNAGLRKYKATGK